MKTPYFFLLFVCSAFSASLTFTFPYSGFVWERGTTQTISWTEVNDAQGPVVSYVKADVVVGSTIRGNVFTTPLPATTNSYQFTMSTSNTWDSTSAVIRITFNDTNQGTQDSPSFRIEQQPLSVLINSPADIGTTRAVFYRGDTLPISISFGAGNATTVAYAIYDSSTLRSSIANNVAITGVDNSYDWTIPNVYATSSYYKVRVSILNAPPVHNPGQFFDSDSFSIQQKPWAVNIISPKDTDIWYLGSNITIEWSTTGTIYSVKLEIAQSTSTPAASRTLIVASTPNTGSYNWTVPVNLVLSRYWYLFVTKVNFSNVHDADTGTVSNSFEIAASPSNLLLVNPTSGSLWKTGTNRQIQWVCLGDIYTVRIELTQSSSTTSTAVSIIADSVDCSLGGFDWQIPQSLSPYRYYYIRISSLTFSPATTRVIEMSSSFEISATEDGPNFPPEPVFDPNCYARCYAAGINGDNFCACSRLCGRLCLPGYKDAFSGYDPFTFETRRPIFDIDFSTRKVTDTAFGIFNTPENIGVTPEAVDLQSATTEIVQDLNSFQKLLSFGASVGVGGDETSNTEGSLSTEYSNMRSKLAGRSVRIGYKEFNRYLFKTTILNTNPASVKLDVTFLEELNLLPLTYNYFDYKAFLDKYGLYYFDYVKFGVSATITSLVNECVFQSNSAESVSVGLEASAKTTNVAGSASFTQAEEDAKNCLAGKTEATMRLLGGDFNLFGCQYNSSQAEFICSGTWNAYANTAKYSPWRLEYRLTRVSRLIANATLRANLDAAISAYLQEVNATVTNVVPRPSTDLPCPCLIASTTAVDGTKEPPAPLSSSLVIGLVVGGIIIAIIIGGVVKQMLCAPAADPAA